MMDRTQKQLAFLIAQMQIAAFGKMTPGDVQLAKRAAVTFANELGLPNPAGMSVPAAMELVWDQLMAERHVESEGESWG